MSYYVLFTGVWLPILYSNKNIYNLYDIFNNISNFNLTLRKLGKEENELILPLKNNKDFIPSFTKKIFKQVSKLF